MQLFTSLCGNLLLNGGHHGEPGVEQVTVYAAIFTSDHRIIHRTHGVRG